MGEERRIRKAENHLKHHSSFSPLQLFSFSLSSPSPSPSPSSDDFETAEPLLRRVTRAFDSKGLSIFGVDALRLLGHGMFANSRWHTTEEVVGKDNKKKNDRN